MRLIGLLSWFDEPVAMLTRCLVGLDDAGVDHVVAVDGRYALYDADHDASSTDEYAAIVLGCRQLGMGCTIHAPAGPWQGGEVEKRTFLFKAGWAVAEEGDWFWVQDADQWTVSAPADLKDRLAATDLDAAEVDMLDMVALQANVPNWPAHFEMRSLFRAQPLRVVGNHVNYMTDDDRHLWGRDRAGGVEDALDLTGCVRVEHHPQERDTDRLAAKLRYYNRRDNEGAERGLCELCEAPAVSLEPIRWRMTEIGPVADWMECCQAHLAGVRVVAADQLVGIGVDPGSVEVTHLNGHAPATVSVSAGA